MTISAETKRVKNALELMSDWLDGDAKKRITSLPLRFDALAKRALLHATSQQLPQIAGGGRHRRSTARELAAHLADLGVEHREVREPVAHIHAVATAVRVLHRRSNLVDLVAVAGALVPVEGRVGRQNNCAELRRELRRFASCTPSR